MAALARNPRLWMALALWASTAMVMTVGMSGFLEPHESRVSLFLFSAGLSLLLHGAFFVTTLRARWLNTRLHAWLMAAGLIPASLLISFALVGTSTQLTSEFSGFGGAAFVTARLC